MFTFPYENSRSQSWLLPKVLKSRLQWEGLHKGMLGGSLKIYPVSTGPLLGT